MMRLQPVLAASLSVLVGLAALTTAAEARGGGGGHGGGGHGGGFGGGGGFHGGGGMPGRGFEGGGGFEPGREGGFRPDAGPYGPIPGGRPNPYARGAIPWINMDYDDLFEQPPNNTGSQQPNDCDYLLKRAMESGSNSDWNLFNDCSHGR